MPVHRDLASKRPTIVARSLKSKTMLIPWYSLQWYTGVSPPVISNASHCIPISHHVSMSTSELWKKKVVADCCSFSCTAASWSSVNHSAMAVSLLNLLVLASWTLAQSVAPALPSASSCVKRSIIVYTSDSSTYLVTDVGTSTFLSTPTFCFNASVSTVITTQPASTVTTKPQEQMLIPYCLIHQLERFVHLVETSSLKNMIAIGIVFLVRSTSVGVSCLLVIFYVGTFVGLSRGTVFLSFVSTYCWRLVSYFCELPRTLQAAHFFCKLSRAEKLTATCSPACS